MKRVITFVFLLLLTIANSAFADDLWDNYGDHNAYGRKPVTDEEFEKALKSKQGNKRNKKIPRGDEFHQSNETQSIKDDEEDLPVLCVPIDLYLTRNSTLPMGHYQVEGYKKDNKPFLKFSQAHFVIAEVPAQETEDDFNQEAVHFVKLLENGDKQVKIIFGSIDFNAYTILDIAE